MVTVCLPAVCLPAVSPVPAALALCAPTQYGSESVAHVLEYPDFTACKLCASASYQVAHIVWYPCSFLLAW